MDKELITYFIKKTDERFDKIEQKIDLVLKMKWEIAGGLAVLSVLVTIGVQIIFKAKGI